MNKNIIQKTIPIFNNISFNNELKKYGVSSSISKPNKLRALLIKKYRDKRINIGDIYDAYFKLSSANEFAYPAKRINSEIRDIKNYFSTDLNKLVKNARYLQTKQNTKEYGYFDYFEVIFGIIDKDIIEYYKGLLNIKVSKKNIPTFYDITQIKK